MNWWVFRYSTKYKDAVMRTRMITSFYECRGKEYYLSTCFLCRETRLQQIWRARFQHLSLGCCSGESILFSSTTVSSKTMRSLNHCPKHASIESGICDFICDTPPFAGNWGFVGEFPCTGTFKDLMIASRPDQYHSFTAVQTVCVLS
jgi:hypothetical protein